VLAFASSAPTATATACSPFVVRQETALFLSRHTNTLSSVVKIMPTIMSFYSSTKETRSAVLRCEIVAYKYTVADVKVNYRPTTQGRNFHLKSGGVQK